MLKKLTAFFLCLCFCFTFVCVSAAEPRITISFEETEITVGESAQLLISVSSEVTALSANIAYNNYFLSYKGSGLGFDVNTGEYTISFTPSGKPHTVTCVSRKAGTATITLTNITCHTKNGTVTLPDVSAEITVNPDYTYIYTKEDLNNIRNNLSGTYLLMNDITFTEEDFSEDGAFYNDGFGWIPIGAVVKTPFTGEFNGNGYTISGLTINKAYYNYCGLFGVSKGVIKNLRIVDASVDGTTGINMSSKNTASQPVDGAIDYEDKNVWTEPDDSITEESLAGYDRTGVSTANLGIVCGFNLGTVKEAYCSGLVIGNNAAGGIAGRNNGNIYLCATNVQVVGSTVAGGIAGVTGTYSQIYDVVAEGGVTAIVAGGLLGNASGSVTRAYVLAEVISDDSFASFGKDANVTASEIYGFGDLNSDGKTEIKEMTELASLRFTAGEWTYTSLMPYPTPLADIIITVTSGDLNGDGEVNTTDLATMKLFLAGVGEADEAAADLNGDGEVNTTDLAEMKLRLAGVKPAL